MKPFISKTLLFLLIAMFSVLILVFTINTLRKHNSNFETDKSVTSLILGHSHPECAYNDLLIDSTANFAQSGESYFYTYIKTKELIKSNPQLKQVFIEFTNDQIHFSKNNWIWEDTFLSDKYPRYSPFMSFEEQSLLLRRNTSGFFNTVALAANVNMYNLINDKSDYTKYIGGYMALDHQLDNSDYDKTKFEDVKQASADSISLINILYLEKLIEYCEAQQVNVYLVRSPLHKNNIDLNNEVLFQSLRNSHFADIEFLDFVDFPLEDSNFADLEHLNSSGAAKYSKWFNIQLNKGFVDVSYIMEQNIN